MHMPESEALARRIAELERELAETRVRVETLEQEKARLEEFIELMPQPVFEVDCGGRIVYGNGKSYELFGYRREEMTASTNILQMIAPEARDLVRESFRRVLLGEQPGGGEYTAMRRDGSRFPVIIFSVPFSSGGQIQGMRGLIIDISARKQMEEAFRESERRYRLIFDTVPVSIWEYDFSEAVSEVRKLREQYLPDCRRFLEEHPERLRKVIEGVKLLNVNPETLRLYGAATREEIAGSYGSRHTPEAIGIYRDALAAFIEGKSHFSGETVNETLDGRRIHVLLHMMIPQRGETRVLVTATDITARKQLGEKRLKADKLESIGLLAGGIAHDFNNILVSVLGNISLARLYAEDAELQGILSAAENATFRARDLTHQLLTFSKGGAPVKETASITGIFRESVGFCLRGASVGCEFILPEDLRPVDADRGQISQVINNLILNAVQAMPDGGTITVGGENLDVVAGSGLPLTPGRYVKVFVRDQGSGIPPENIPRLFDPYFTTKETGSGLGLATSWSIIRNHGGHILAESVEGRGAVFTFYLPAAENLPEPEKPAHAPRGNHTGRILVMDDEKTVRDILSRLLRYLGHEAETCREGKEALARYRMAREKGRPFDAVIMDLTVPGGMGGKEAVRDLLEYDPRGRVIVSSGYSSERIVSDYREYGFRAVLPKPYEVDELREVVDRVLGSGE